jgi:hypothetical protein
MRTLVLGLAILLSACGRQETAAPVDVVGVWLVTNSLIADTWTFNADGSCLLDTDPALGDYRCTYTATASTLVVTYTEALSVLTDQLGVVDTFNAERRADGTLFLQRPSANAGMVLTRQ